jgi:hypothetical protein
MFEKFRQQYSDEDIFDAMCASMIDTYSVHTPTAKELVELWETDKFMEDDAVYAFFNEIPLTDEMYIDDFLTCIGKSSTRYPSESYNECTLDMDMGIFWVFDDFNFIVEPLIRYKNWYKHGDMYFRNKEAQEQFEKIIRSI